MKALKYLLAIVAGLFLFAACQKEYSVEGQNGGIATGSLKNVNGDCQPVSIFGLYIQDSTLQDSNYVVVQVNFTSAGSYKIFTDTANGFSFKDSGYMSNTGLQSITLKASGKPLFTQPTSFTVAFDTSFCSFTVNVIGKTPAVYSLAGSPDVCSNSDVRGNYTTGTPLSSTNQVILQVNVTTVGSYYINTSTVGGITFSGAGNFTATGLQNVTLQGSGTPTIEGTNTIPVTAGSSSCSFDVTVVAGTGGSTDPNDADTAWQFTGSQKFQGPFYDVFDTTRPGIGYGLVFLGYTPATGDTLIQMGVVFGNGGSIQPGTYTTNTAAGFYFTDYKDTANPVDIYTADPSVVNASTQITISSYDPTTKIITGTFAGTAINSSNSPVPISGGRFKAKVR